MIYWLVIKGPVTRSAAKRDLRADLFRRMPDYVLQRLIEVALRKLMY